MKLPVCEGIFVIPNNPEIISTIDINGVRYVREQSKLQSHKETLSNILWGFSISSLFNFLYLTHVSWGDTKWDALLMTAILTVTSYLRAYIIRRCFNRRQR